MTQNDDIETVKRAADNQPANRRPTVGIHVGPPPVIGGDRVVTTDDPVRPCRGCGERKHHKVSCPVRDHASQVRDDQRWQSLEDHRPDPVLPEDDYSLTEPELRAELARLRADQDTDNVVADPGPFTAPALGELAEIMRRWQSRGVTGEAMHYAASKVWPEVDLVTVTRVERERDRLLGDAGRMISGDREDAYGSARDGFTRTGKLIAAIIDVDEITAEQVALILSALKLSRLAQNTGHRDSWVDLIGYAALGGDIAADTAADPNA